MLLNYFVDRNEERCCFLVLSCTELSPTRLIHIPGTIALDGMEGAIGEFFLPKEKKKEGLGED